MIQRVVRQRRSFVEDPSREPEVVFDEAIGEVHFVPPFGDDQPRGRMEVDAVRRGKPVRCRRAAMCRRRPAVGVDERASECARCLVPRGESDPRDRLPAIVRETPRGAFEQQSPAERCRRLADREADDPIEVKPAQERAPCELAAVDRLIHRLEQQVKVSPKTVRTRVHDRIIGRRREPALSRVCGLQTAVRRRRVASRSVALLKTG